MATRRISLSVLFPLFVLAACGGGGGGGDGGGSSATNTAPVASFVASPAEGIAPLDVVLDGSSSRDPDGQITSYSWNFGDGTANGSGVSVSHRYEAPGDYQVRLTVTDDKGVTSSSTKAISAKAITAASRYSVTFLPSPDGSPNAMPLPQAMNNSGEVVGEIPVGAGSHAFLYSGQMTADLGTLGGAESFGLGINDAGSVVGWSINSVGALRGFLYRAGQMTDIGGLGGPETVAADINSQGIVTGTSLNAANEIRAFTYQNGVFQALGTLGGDWSFGEAINDSGAVTGTSQTADGSQHAFLYRNGAMEDLGTLGGQNSSGIALNTHGDVVGSSQTEDETLVAGFIYVNGVRTPIRLERYQSVYPTDVNADRQVVGFGEGNSDYDQFAFVWHASNGIRNLNDLVDPAIGCRFLKAYGINDSGQIVVAGDCVDGMYEWGDSFVGAILTPER